MVFGREKEFDELNTLYGRTGFRAIGIYGRRKVGKTFLLQEFSKGKKVIYFSALDSSIKQNLSQLQQAIQKLTEGTNQEMPDFNKYEDAFKYIRDILKKERILFIIDDYQYLVSSDKNISMTLKKSIDNILRSTNMLLLICGTPEKLMREVFENPKSALYKKISGTIIIEPFNYIWTAKMVPNFKSEELAVIYGITGGVPGYIKYIDNDLSLKENIINLYLKNDSYLCREPENIIKMTLREPAYYNAIIEEIVNGAETINAISEKTDMETATTSTYIKPLLALGIVEKRSALTEENNRKKTLYRVSDYLFAFWHKLEMNNKYLRGTEDPDEIYEKKVKPLLDEYMKEVFYDISMEYIEEMNRQRELQFKYERLGIWWGKNTRTKENIKLDIYALNDSDKKALYGACKYDEKPMDIEDMFELMEKAKNLEAYDNKFYILISKNGFAEDVLDIIKNNKSIKYIELDDMYSFFSK